MTCRSRVCAGLCRRGTAGFLLTETLATFTISAFVLLGLVTASSTLLHAVDRCAADVQDVDDLGRTIAAIKRDVSQLTRARWNGYEPQAFVFRGGANSLFFARTQRDPDGSSQTRVIALREIVVRSGTRLMRSEARLSATAASFGDLSFGQPRDIGGGTARFRFYYVAPAGGKVGSARLREWPIGLELPTAIVVDAVDPETRRLIMSVRVPIRANADIGCLTQDNANDQSASAMPAAPVPADPSAGNAPSTPTSTASATDGAEGGTKPHAFCGRADVSQESANGPSDATAGQAKPTGSPL